MATVAFKMYLKPGNGEVYKQRHDQIWPELKELLKKEGISNYYIFLDEDTNALFAIQDQAPGHSSQNLRASKVMQKWWDFMADLMDVNADNSPVATPLEQVFFME